MNDMFSDRIADVPRSFIREILKVAIDESVISFAGGLPNRDLFPVNEIRAAADRVFAEHGKEALQYSSSEGDAELRAWIARRYELKKGLRIDPRNILITTGSQQGLDLLGKTLVNDGDGVIIEEPGYLGAIQAFSLYRPVFFPVPIHDEGIDVGSLARALAKNAPKLFYCVPNFQNPAGISYTEENRHAVADLLKGRNTILVEDDPYGDLRFLGQDKPSLYQFLPDITVMLGSFSKIVAPSLRIGWIVANDALMEKLITAKQASDLHTNYLGQKIILQYLKDNDLDLHIDKIRNAYGRQREAMVAAIQEHFPTEISCTQPEGGMFLWITLPQGISALTVFERAIEKKVAFVPGDPFYVGKKNVNTLRLNFSCVDEETIRTGIQRMGEVLKNIVRANRNV
jgi:2-aminoadipate transaminase